jgi:hypothetical protein
MLLPKHCPLCRRTHRYRRKVTVVPINVLSHAHRRNPFLDFRRTNLPRAPISPAQPMAGTGTLKLKKQSRSRTDPVPSGPQREPPKRRLSWPGHPKTIQRLHLCRYSMGKTGGESESEAYRVPWSPTMAPEGRGRRTQPGRKVA